MGDLLRFDPIARRIGREPARRRIDDLLEADDPAKRIRELDPLYLYGLIHEVGVDDALPVLHLASGDQSQALVDFDCWDGDQLVLDRLEGWLAAHLQAPLEHIIELHDRLDPELLGLLLKNRIEVYFYEDEEDAELIDRIEGPIESSPDGVYAIVMPDNPGQADLLRSLLRALYASDQDAARQLLHHARHELRSQLEETAYQMRNGRIEQSGFLPFEEAVALYSAAQPARERQAAAATLADAEAPLLELHVPDAVAVPVALAGDLLRITDDDSGSFVGAALRSAVDAGGDLEAADRLLLQLESLVNRTVVADRGRPGDPDDSRAALSRTHAMLNIGLEYLTYGRADEATRLVERWPLKRIFQTGYGLATSLAAQARKLSESGTLSLADELRFSLCTADEAALLEGLLERRPVRSAETRDDFATLDQVEEAARILALLAYKSVLTFSSDQSGTQPSAARDHLVALVAAPGAAVPIDDVGFDGILATRAALRVLELDELRLLSRDELALIVRDHISPNGPSATLARALASVAEPPQLIGAGGAPLAAQWVSEVGHRLSEEYGDLVPEAIADDPEVLPALLLFAS